MPSLYLNTEVGACDTESQALHCISRTMTAYEIMKKHVFTLYQEESALSKLKICSEAGKASFISEIFHKLDDATKKKLSIFMHDLAKGSIVELQTIPTKTLKLLDVPSPFLEYVLTQNGMILSFASNACWEKDRIEFNECDEFIPNIWGQTEFSSFTKWLNQRKTQTSTIFSQIKNEFNIKFCDCSIESSFTEFEWEMIYSALQKANNCNFNVSKPLISKWSDLPIYYIRDKNHSNFTMRIFFIKKDRQIYVGEIYHKNESNTNKEETAAHKSYGMFCTWGLFDN